MLNGKCGRRSHTKFVLNGADSTIFLESLQDTCESCEAVTCALCALYHLNKRIESRTIKSMTRKQANSIIEYMERGHITVMNKKYDQQNRFEHDEWNCGNNGNNGNCNDYTENDECVNIIG